MKYIALLLSAGAVWGCQSTDPGAKLACANAGLIQQFSGVCDKVIADRAAANNAADDATCRSYGAMIGTDIYVQCRVGLVQARAAASRPVVVQRGPDPILQNPLSSTTTILPNGRIQTCQNITNSAGTLSTCQ